MMFKFGKNQSEEPVHIDPVDGPGQPIEIHTPAPGTKRLSQKGKYLLVGVSLVVIGAILIGVVASGGKKREASLESKKQVAAGDAPGQAAPYKEDEMSLKRRSAAAAALTAEASAEQPMEGSQTGPLTSRSAGQKNGSGSQNASGGAGPVTPAEAHQIWLTKRKFERIQGRLMASDSAETADISKGGASLSASRAANGMADLGGAGSDVMAELSQKMAAANGRSSNARAQVAAENLRMASMPQAGQGAGAGSGMALASLGGGAPGQDSAVAAQARNKAFMKEAADNGYLPELLKPKMGEFELTAGSVIPAVMLSGINSDLPGTIVAQTRQTIYSTNEPDAVVIPQGSRLIGRYSADVAYGQSRVLAAWDELILPNGSRISLRGMSAADGQGQSGIEDQVNNHFWKTWSSALLVSMLGVASQQSQPQNQGAFNTPSGSAQASAAAVNSLSEVGSAILKKGLNISPTLQVRPGMTFNVMVNRSIILPSYR